MFEPYAVIFQSPCGKFRITQNEDYGSTMDDLKGDMFNPDLIKEMGYTGTVEDLKRDEEKFEADVVNNGIWGYALEEFKDGDWDVIDSCGGFIGEWDPNNEKFNHYIVQEMKDVIAEKTGDLRAIVQKVLREADQK